MWEPPGILCRPHLTSFIPTSAQSEGGQAAHALMEYTGLLVRKALSQLGLADNGSIPKVCLPP